MYNMGSFPKDDMKPRFVLEIEVMMTKYRISVKEQEIKIIEEENAKSGKP